MYEDFGAYRWEHTDRALTEQLALQAETEFDLFQSGDQPIMEALDLTAHKELSSNAPRHPPRPRRTAAVRQDGATYTEIDGFAGAPNAKELGDLDAVDPEIVSGTLPALTGWALGHSRDGVASSHREDPVAPRWLNHGAGFDREPHRGT